MPSSPQTPTHSRNASNISFSTPNHYDSSPRRTSMHSPDPGSFQRSNSISMDVFSSGGPPPMNGGMGLGNLADELADAWGDDEEDEEPDMNFQEERTEEQTTRDSGVDVSPMPPPTTLKPVSITPPNGVRGHRWKTSDYDGSDYGDSSDLESPGVPPGLVARMDMVESLARRGTEVTGTESDAVVSRLVEGLKDLGGQSGVEGNATRLITAHSALSTHIIHQTRLLQSLTYPLISPFSLPPDEDTIDDLLPLLIGLSEAIPRPTTTSLSALTALHTTTAELIQTLNSLSDTLHMSRQTTTTASRRLKSARELVFEMRKEDDAREEGERWLSQGNWGERLGRRECADVCGDVVGGFEEVCNGWRARLVAQAEAVA